MQPCSNSAMQASMEVGSGLKNDDMHYLIYYHT